MTRPDFSDATLKKADAIDPALIWRDEEHPKTIFWVASASGPKKYRVQLAVPAGEVDPQWITCTCPHGLNTGAGSTKCYHAAAVLNLLDSEQDDTTQEKTE